MEGARWRMPVLGLAVLMVGAACSSSTEPDAVEIEAVVEFRQVEGGCWALRSVDDVSYEPVDLAEEFRQDGLEVDARVRPVEDAGSICQVGILVRVEDIRTRN